MAKPLSVKEESLAFAAGAVGGLANAWVPRSFRTVA